MSSYIDHYRTRRVTVQAQDGQPAFRHEKVCVHSWAAHTQARLSWLYPGEDRANSAEARADLAAWARLGRKAVAA